MIFIGAVLFLGCGGLCSTLVYYLAQGPDTWVSSGAQLPIETNRQIIALVELESGEDIMYFYSPGIFSIDEEFYMATDRRVIMYSKEWDPRAVVVPYAEVVEASANFSTDFYQDSTLAIQTSDESSVTVFASNENGGDKLMFDYIQKRIAESAGNGRGDTGEQDAD